MTAKPDHRFAEVVRTLDTRIGLTSNFGGLVDALKEAAQALSVYVTKTTVGVLRPELDRDSLLLWAEEARQGSFWEAASLAISGAAEDADLRITVWTLAERVPGYRQTYVATTGIYSSIAVEDEDLPERLVFADGATVDTGDIVGVRF
jgi:hypothetical protein